MVMRPVRVNFGMQYKPEAQAKGAAIPSLAPQACVVPYPLQGGAQFTSWC